MIDHRAILLGTVLVGLVGGKAFIKSKSSPSGSSQMLSYPSSGGATFSGGSSASVPVSGSGSSGVNSLLSAIDTVSSNVPTLAPVSLLNPVSGTGNIPKFNFSAPAGPKPGNLVSQAVGYIPLVGGLLQPATNYLWSNQSVINPFGNNYLGGALNFGTGHLLGINQPFGKQSVINPFGSNFLGGVPGNLATGAVQASKYVGGASGSMSVVNPFGHNFLGGIFNGL